MFRYLVRYNKRHEGNEWWRKEVGPMNFEGSQPSGAKAHADKPVDLRARSYRKAWLMYNRPSCFDGIPSFAGVIGAVFRS
jgi:hypothetical protein